MLESGSTFSAYTTDNYTTYFIKGDKDSSLDNFKILKDLLLYPEINKNKINNEKPCILYEKNESVSELKNSKTYYFNSLVDNKFSIENILGSDFYINNMNINLLKYYYYKYYRANNFYFICLGIPDDKIKFINEEIKKINQFFLFTRIKKNYYLYKYIIDILLSSRKILLNHINHKKKIFSDQLKDYKCKIIKNKKIKLKYNYYEYLIFNEYVDYLNKNILIDKNIEIFLFQEKNNLLNLLITKSNNLNKNFSCPNKIDELKKKTIITQNLFNIKRLGSFRHILKKKKNNNNDILDSLMKNITLFNKDDYNKIKISLMKKIFFSLLFTDTTLELIGDLHTNNIDFSNKYDLILFIDKIRFNTIKKKLINILS